MQQITIEWLNGKVGALYIANQMLQEELQKLFLENEALKKAAEKAEEKTQ